MKRKRRSEEEDLAGLCSYGELYWYGCYSGLKNWSRFVSEESVVHPAKMSPRLCERIFLHLEALGLLKPGHTIVDFMSGIGTTNVVASMHGYDSIAVELEPHFTDLMQKNREKVEKVLGRKINWQVIQGDSRKLTELLRDKAGLAGITSPPYIERHAYGDSERELMRDEKLKSHPDSQIGGIRMHTHENSLNPKNIGNLPDKPLAGITSPPYLEAHSAQGNPGGIVAGNRQDLKKYLWTKGNQGQTEGQLANLPDKPLAGITSPPYGDSLNDGRITYEQGKKMAMAMYKKHGRSFSEEDLEHQIQLLLKRCNREWKEMEGQIGNLPDKELAGIVSPPYSEAQTGGGIAVKGYRGAHMDEQGKDQPDKVGERCGYMKECHGATEGNIGNLPDKPLAGITSPPYTDIGHIAGDNADASKHPERLKMQRSWTESMRSEGNIQKLPDRDELAGIVSPPYDNRLDGGGKDMGGLRPYSDEPVDSWFTERDPTNIGNLVSDTKSRDGRESYLSAMRQVYSEAYAAGISPLVTVTKNPTRDGKLRRLDLDTKKLLEEIGYRIVDYHRSVLFRESTQATFDDQVKKKEARGRVSFFKRLHISKGGVAARYEDILIAVIDKQ